MAFKRITTGEVVEVKDGRFVTPQKTESNAARPTGWDERSGSYYGKNITLKKTLPSRKEMEDELASLRKSYMPVAAFGGMTDEDRETKNRISYLQNELRRMDSDDYYSGVLDRLSKLDNETISYLDQLNAGKPKDTTVAMQGIADNRSWEERYAEEQEWENRIMRQLAKKGYTSEQVAQMRKDRTRQVNRETYDAEVAKSKAEAEENGFKASLKSVPQNLTGGLGVLSLAAQNAHRALTGDDTPVDYYTPEMIGQAKAQAARQTVSERLEENTNFSTKLTGNVASFLYNTGMSMADTAAIALMTSVGIPPSVGTTLLGGTAATGAAVEAKNRGVSDGQALLTGLTAGVAEAVFERYSLGNLLDTKPAQGVLRDRIFGTMKNMGIQALVEGSEETATSLANALTDAVINGDASAFRQSVFDYMRENSASYEEAERAATKDFILSVAQDFLGGALSGGAMGGVQTGIQTAKQNAQAKKVYGADAGALVSESLEIAPENAFAQKMQGKLDDGKRLTGSQLSRLVQQNEATLKAQDLTTIQNAVNERLTALGETGDLATISAALAKQAAGEKLTRAEEQVIANSKYGQRVANEMNADNIAEGGFASDWAQDLGTNRINAETHNAPLMKLANEMAGVKPADAPAAKAGQETVAPVDDSAPAPTAPVTARYMASDEVAVVAAAVKEMGVSPMVEQSLVDNFDGTDGRIYAADVKLAYQYGKMNFPKSSLEKLDIKPYQAERAYMLGRSDAKAEAIAPKVKRTVSGKRGTVIFETAVDENTLTPIQKASLNGIQAIADLSGLNVHVFESQQTEDGYKFTLPDGTVTGANGWYVTGTNDIWVDLNAGNAGEGTMLYTASHEISHFIKEWSPDKWRGLADTLLEQYGEDVPLDALLERQMEKIRKRDSSLKDNALMDAAYEELVSDALSEMLTDGTVVQKMAELKQKDRTLWEKIKDAIHALLEKWGVIRKEYEGRSVAPEAEFLRGMDDAFNKLQQLYAEAFVEASENYAASEQVLAEAGIAVNAKTDSASLLSVRDVLTDAQRNKVASALVERFGVTKQEAMEWLKAETSMASIILNPKYSMYLDYEGDPNELAIKQNSDYPQGTVDFSNICKKRREFTQVMNRVLRNFPRHVFAATDLAKIRTIMGQEGMTLPCGICYVEDRRQLDSIVAQDFIDGLKLYREGSKTRPDGNPFNPNQLKGLQLTDGDTYVPTIYELITLEGRNSLKAKNPNMEAAWVKYNNARGMNAVRLLTNEAEYKRQILKYNAKTVQSKNDHGGLRIYSFSDMEMFHLIDIVQVITDSAAVGLKLQGYTKVNEYARAVKDTGEKLNRSLIPAGDLGYHMEGGKVVLDYDTVEGIDIHHKDFFDNKENPNVGNIVIGINDTQIRAAMLSDFIDQIIPFHTGQSKDVLGEKGISAWENYKDYQNEKDLATGKTSKKQINIYTDVIQAAEQEGNPIQNKRQFVEKFLEVCKKNGLKPRFAQFLNTDANGEYVYTEGYHKFLVDFKTFAQTEVGEYLPQMPVKPIFDDAYITGLLRDYVKEQKAKDAQVAKQMPKVVERITNEIVKPSEKKYSDRNYNPVREALAKQGLDSLSEKLGSRFPLSASFDAVTRADNTSLVMETVKANQVVYGKGVSIYKAGKDAFRKAYGIKTSVHIKQMGIDAMLYVNVANESISKAQGNRDEQSTLDVIPHIKEVLENGVLLGVERIAHTHNKGTALYGYRMYNLYWYDNGKTKTPNCLVCTVVQSTDAAEGYVFQNIENVTIDQGLPGNKAGMSPPINDDGYTVAQMYAAVKKIPRKDGGLKYTADERSQYLFPYTKHKSGKRYSDRDTDSVSNRDLLAGAFEDIAQNDIERGKIQEYRTKVEQLNEQEQKLAEIRKELKELSFAKGPRDKEKISKLRDEAAKIANRIGIVDKQLLRLEASAPLMAVLEREKKLAYGRASQKWGDRMETARTGRNKTEMRHKIKRVVNELNQLLLNGSKDRHVMIGLQKATAEALSAINMDTVTADERLAKIQEKIDKATNPAEIAKLQQSYARVEKMGMNMATRLTALKNAYEDIKDSNDPLVANAYQPEIEERIKNLRKMVGDTPLQNMSMEQLEYVYDTYTMVLTTIRDANKAFKNTKGKTIAVLGNQAMEEIQSVGGKHPLAVKALKGPLNFAWSGMKPVYAFKTIGSDTLSEMFDNIRTGEDTWAVDVSEAKEFYRQKTRQYHFDSWDFEQQHSFTSKTGKKFNLTLEQIMSLYAYSKRKQADAHLDKGGFVFDDAIEVVQKKHGIPVKYTVKTADAHNLSYETLMAICKTLTDEQVKFVDEMQEYLSSTMGGKGNEVSLELYGVKLFKEKYYFPLKSAKQYMFEQNEVAGEVKIKNSGFSKQTVEHASNPVILSNFTEVWANHVNDMAMYHAFVLPLEDFNRVFNYKTPNAANADTESVKMYLQNAYGRQPEQYIRQLLTDLNGGARSDPNAGIINKGIGMFKKAAVFSSLSVVVQQPSSIARAAALIDTKYFVNKPSTKAWDEVKKYAPIAIIKEMGYFDTNMGVSTVEFIKAKEYTGAKAKMAALVTDSQYRDEILSKAPAVADEMAWCYIWEAVKKEVAAKGLKGEELLQAAGKRFTEVIVSTQVYDSVLSRSGLMRSKDTGVKMATAFMAEPTTSLNMITDALIQGKRGNKAYARKAIGSVIASMILNSILVSFVYAGRDDDEDKSYVEKYIGTLTEELMDSFNPLTLIPFVKDIVSIVQGYDVERSDMAVVTDLYKAWRNLSSSNRSVYRKVEDFAGAIAAGFSLPVKNIMRDVRGIYNTVMSFVRGPKTTGRGIGEAVRDVTPKWLGGGERSNGEELYHAMLHDDAQHAARVKARFKNEIDVAYAIRDGLVKNDPRITAAAEARVAGKQSEYMRIAREITSEKHFSQDDVVRAINYVTEKMRKVESTPSLSDPDTFKVLDYFNEAMSNDQAEAELVKREMISKLMKEGKTAEEAETSFNISFKNSAVKPAFTEGKLSVERAVSLLQKYGGMDEDMATADVQYWAFKQNYPDIPVDDSWFDKYYEYAADVNIPIDTFMKYKNEVKNIDGEGKKARRMAVIDSLPLTYEQKDALYYSEGWVASTIHDAPWH